MDITLITAVGSDLVHGTENDKKTGCGINLLKADNVTRYRRAGKMTDLKEITCEKCKSNLAKKIIKADKKEMARLLKEEKQREKMGVADEGIVPLGNTTARITGSQPPKAEEPVPVTAPEPQFTAPQPVETPQPIVEESVPEPTPVPVPQPEPEPIPEPEPVQEAPKFITGTGIAIDDDLAAFAINVPKDEPEPEPELPEDDFLAQFAIQKPKDEPDEPQNSVLQDDFLAQFAIPVPGSQQSTAEESAPVAEEEPEEMNELEIPEDIAQTPIPSANEPEIQINDEDDIMKMFSVEAAPVKTPTASIYDNDSSVIDIEEHEMSAYEPPTEEEVSAPAEEIAPEEEDIEADLTENSDWNYVANQIFGFEGVEQPAEPTEVQPVNAYPVQEGPAEMEELPLPPVIEDIAPVEEPPAPELEDIAFPTEEIVAPEPSTAEEYGIPETEKIPTFEEYVAPETEQIPAVEEYTAPETEETPTFEEYVAPETEETPAVEEYAAPVTEETPTVEEYSAPEAEEIPTVEEYTAPEAEEIPAVEEYTAPETEETPAPEENITEIENISAPVQEETPVAEAPAEAAETEFSGDEDDMNKYRYSTPIFADEIRQKPAVPTAPVPPVAPAAPVIPQMAQPQIINVPQFAGYDQNGQPIYSYVQMQLTGYDQNGQPMFAPIQGQNGIPAIPPIQPQAAPMQPTASIPPVQPVTPIQPTVPVQPAAPVQPTVPVQPTAPAQPTAPVQSTAPVQPTAPAQPTAPVQQTTPAQPAATPSQQEQPQHVSAAVAAAMAAERAAQANGPTANISKIAVNPHSRSTSQAFINAIASSKNYADKNLIETQGLRANTPVLTSIEDVLSTMGDDALKRKQMAAQKQAVPQFEEYKSPSRTTSSAPTAQSAQSAAPAPQEKDVRQMTKAELKAKKKQDKIDAKFRKEMAKRGL